MAVIVGVGGYLPDHVVTNDDWAETLDTSDEWISQRTGIKTRRRAAAHESSATMATAAVRAALAHAELDASHIDEIILATDTREVATPDTAAFVQAALGCREIAAYDLGGSGCAGFVQALDVAATRADAKRSTVAVVGVELISRLIADDDRATAVLFGDGAGAVVVRPGTDGPTIGHAVTGTDGSKWDILTLEVGGVRRPFSAEEAASGAHQHLVMQGREVFREAVARMTESVHAVLAAEGATVADIDLLVPHQANKRIIDAVGRKLGIDPAAVFVNVDTLGNTGSASVPIALWQAIGADRIRPGDLVVLTAFGAGFHWGGLAIRW